MNNLNEGGTSTGSITVTHIRGADAARGVAVARRSAPSSGLDSAFDVSGPGRPHMWTRSDPRGSSEGKDAAEAAAVRRRGAAVWCPGHLPPQPRGPAARSRAELRAEPQQCATPDQDPQPCK